MYASSPDETMRNGRPLARHAARNRSKPGRHTARAEWRPGFEAFVEACRAAGRPFLVVSAGLDAYIEPVLERLPAPLRAHVEVRANRATIGPAVLDVGFNLDPDHAINERQAAVQFTVGMF